MGATGGGGGGLSGAIGEIGRGIGGCWQAGCIGGERVAEVTLSWVEYRHANGPTFIGLPD